MRSHIGKSTGVGPRRYGGAALIGGPAAVLDGRRGAGPARSLARDPLHRRGEWPGSRAHGRRRVHARRRRRGKPRAPAV